ncbi:unnamed protein product [Cuscuta campestris]|uniref:Uncharacterized protein n=1 Tax=Cuscuta campestris TaxID=132261 RepID=A0A484KB64_9ASTE|nr:unnamed protein product [Cuscuta campestris]
MGGRNEIVIGLGSKRRNFLFGRESDGEKECDAGGRGRCKVEEYLRHGVTEKASVVNHALQAEQEFITGYIWDRLAEANPEYFQVEEATAPGGGGSPPAAELERRLVPFTIPQVRYIVKHSGVFAVSVISAMRFSDEEVEEILRNTPLDKLAVAMTRFLDSDGFRRAQLQARAEMGLIPMAEDPYRSPIPGEKMLFLPVLTPPPPPAFMAAGETIFMPTPRAAAPHRQPPPLPIIPGPKLHVPRKITTYLTRAIGGHANDDE